MFQPAVFVVQALNALVTITFAAFGSPAADALGTGIRCVHP
jgi:hypothetical protein